MLDRRRRCLVGAGRRAPDRCTCASRWRGPSGARLASCRRRRIQQASSASSSRCRRVRLWLQYGLKGPASPDRCLTPDITASCPPCAPARCVALRSALNFHEAGACSRALCGWAVEASRATTSTSCRQLTGLVPGREQRAVVTCPVEAHRALPEPDERDAGASCGGPGSRVDHRRAVGNTCRNVSVPDALKSVRFRAVPPAVGNWTVSGFKLRAGSDTRLTLASFLDGSKQDLPATLLGGTA